MSQAHAAPQGLRDNLTNALSSWQTRRNMLGIREGSQLEMMDGLRKFNMEDKYEAVKLGELDKNAE